MRFASRFGFFDAGRRFSLWRRSRLLSCLLVIALVSCLVLTPGGTATALVPVGAGNPQTPELQESAQDVLRFEPGEPKTINAPSDTASPTFVTAAAATGVFADSFETWPGPWSISSATGAAWGQTSYRASAGSSAAYCAGSSITAPGPYADDMETWLVAGSFDLSTYDEATLSFDLWLVSENGPDIFAVGVSTDGTNFDVLTSSGDSGGWALDNEFDLSDFYGDGSLDYTGESAVWIAFVFSSDFSITYEGAYVDNVELTADVNVNTPPVAVANSYQTDEDEKLTVAAPGVLGNDSDGDGDSITASKVSGPSHGTLSLSSNGGFTYTPTSGYFGSDSFTYRAYDGEDYSNTVAVTITVNEVEDELPPVLVVAGDNRYATAVSASKLAYPKGATTVVIATGQNWPDALGGSALAGALEGPILLTKPDSLPGAVTAEITRLKATRAVILGGTSAVSTAVENELKSQLADVSRIAGNNRYDTANRVARRVISELGAAYDGKAFVSTGGNFPDALAAAPLAAAKKWPLFLAKPGTGISTATRNAMAGVKNVVIIGGTAAVSSATETDLRGSFGVTRLAGNNRYATAAAIAKYGVSNAGLGWNRTGIATGENYPDALAGGVLQGKVGSVMLLTPTSSLCNETGYLLLSKRASITTVTFFGGTGALSESTRNNVLKALDGTWSPPVDPPAEGDIADGVWHGLIKGSTYEAVTINVRDNKITTEGSTLPQGASMVVKFPYSNVTMISYVYSDIAITDGKFTHETGSVSSSGGRIQVSGTFSSGTSVTGSASHDEDSWSTSAHMDYDWFADR